MKPTHSMCERRQRRSFSLFSSLSRGSLLLAALLLGGAHASAAPTTPAQAKTVVQAWLGLNPTPLDTSLGALVQKVDTYNDAGGAPLYYVVSLNPSGFVVVAGDDQVEPIVAFAPEGTYDPSPDNHLGAMVTTDLPSRILLARSGAAAGAAGALGAMPTEDLLDPGAKWRLLLGAGLGELDAGLGSVSDTRVAPLLQSRWDQTTAGGSACYNYYTPPGAEGTSSNYPCGCVATAMAQLMRFHQHPTTGVGTQGFYITVDGTRVGRYLRGGDGSGGPYDWANMVLVPGGGTTTVQRQAIGSLCHDAGLSVFMDYTSSGSGADTLAAAWSYRNIFLYTGAVAAWNDAAQLGSAVQAMTNPNLDAGWPVIFGIKGTYGGHAIVCDGYGYNSGTLYHHLNMGWSGTSNAWYNLPNIDAAIPFTTLYKCIYNVYTTGSGEIISGRVTDTGGAPLSGATVTATRTLGGTYTATTNAQGIYALRKVPSASQYTVEVSLGTRGFAPKTTTTGTSTEFEAISGNVWGLNFVQLPNNAPSAGNDTYSATEDTLLVVNAPGVLANDSDSDGDPITAVWVTGSGPNHGSLTLSSNGSFIYMPALNWTGPDSFRYRARDGAVNSAEATVTINVSPVNDAPVLAAIGNKTAGEGLLLTFTAAATDPEVPGQTLTFSLVGAPAGAAINASSGVFTWTPGETQAPGTYTFEVRVADNGVPSLSDSEVIQVTVDETNAVPTVDPIGAKSVDEEQLLTFSVSGTDSDDPVQTLTYSASGLPTGAAFDAGTRTFTWTPTEAQGPGDYDVTFTVTDNGTPAQSGSEIVRIHVNEVNKAPVAVGDSYTTNEDTALTVPAPGVVVNDTDVDGNPLTAAVATGPAHGTVVVNSDGSFTYTPAADWNGTDGFTYVVSDGSGGSDTGAVVLTVSPVNDRPIAVADAYSVDEDGSLTVPYPGILANDIDIDLGGGDLTAALVAGPAHGTLSAYAVGGFTYTPNADFTGTDTWVYRTWDGQSYSEPATVTITVKPTIDPPVGVADAYSTNEDTALTVAAPGVVANDTDPDGDTLSAALAAGPAHGTVTLNANGSFTYTPEADWSGTDTFTYKAGDGGLESAETTVTITVSPVNDRPAAADDSYSTSEDTPLSVAAPGVLGADTDLEGDSLTAVLVAAPKHGTLTLNPDGSFTYRPIANWNGTDTFTYKVNDGGADSTTATASIVVSAVNDAPLTANDSFVTDEDAALMVAAPGVLGNDTDIDGNALAAVLVAGPAHGTLTLEANGSFTYTPEADWSGTDTFTYTAGDGTAGSEIATVSLTVRAVSDAPVAANDAYTTDEDAALMVAAAGVLVNDTDLEGDALTAVLVDGPAHGTVTLNPDGSFTYTPAANWSGTDTFTYKANDGTVESGVATVTLTVNAVADAPAAADDSYVCDEDSALMVAAAGVLANDADPDGDALTAVLVAGPAHGALTPNADGSFTYTPAADWSGTDTFTYKANDGTRDGNVATVTITVRATNDAPAAAEDSYATDEDTALVVLAPGVLVNDSDLEGGSLAAVLVAGPAHGTLSLSANGAFTYRPAANWHGTDTFTYQATDGTNHSTAAVVSITVRPANDRPAAVNNYYTTNEDATLTVAAAGVLENDTDRDGDALSAVLVEGPAHGALTLNADGSFTYAPAANWYGSDTFTYQASDGSASSSPARVTITVRGMADLSLVAANCTAVIGGDATGGKIVLTGPAPAGGFTVSLSSSDPAVTVPASVTIGAGEARATFAITTAAVTADTPVTITAAGGGCTKTATLTVKAVTVSRLSVAPTAVMGGRSAAGWLRLNTPARAGGVVVALSSSDASVGVPASVAIAAGATTAAFPITTSAVAANTAVTITAACGGASRIAMLTVKAPTPYLLVVSPASIIGGYPVVGSRVLLNAPAPAGGLVVALESSNPAVANVPATVTVPAGTTCGTFAISTTAVSAAAGVTIKATAGEVSRTATLTVRPRATR